MCPFLEPIQIHVVAMYNRNHPSCEEIGGEIQEKEEGFTYGVH